MCIYICTCLFNTCACDMYINICIHVPHTELALWGSHGLKGWYASLTFQGSVSNAKCASRWGHRHRRNKCCRGCRTEVGRFQNMCKHNANESHFLQMFTGPMKY